MPDLEFTGERLVPGQAEAELTAEHVARYRFGAQFVSNASVLDLGCGAGYGAMFLVEAGASSVVGADIAQNAVRYARAKYGNERVRFTTADAYRLPFPDRCFDCVTCFEVLEHVDEVRTVLREASRVLQPNGIFVASTPNRIVYSGRIRSQPNPFHVHEMDRDEFFEILSYYFDDVTLYGQAVVEGVLIQREELNEESILRCEALDRRARFGSEDQQDHHEPDYFLAVCRPRVVSRKMPEGAVYLAPLQLLDRLREHVTEISRDLDEKRAWALRLDREIKQREREVLALHADLEEKVQWAHSLQARIDFQQHVIIELRDALELQRPSGGEANSVKA